MAFITTRSLTNSSVSANNIPKASALTAGELDSNFLNLEIGKLENTTDEFTGILTFKGSGGSAGGAVEMYDDDDSNKLTIQAPATIGTNYTLTLPADNGGSGEVLTTDGDGVLTWTAKTALTGLDIDGFADGSSITIAGTDDFLIRDGDGVEKKVNASQIATFVSTSTATELNIMDGSATTQATVTLAGTDGVVISDADVMKQALVSDFDTYVSGTTSTLTNKTLTSAKVATSLTTAASNTDMIIKPDATGLTDAQNGIQGDWGWGGGVTHFNSPITVGTSDTPDHAQLYNGGIQVTTSHLNWATLCLKQKSDNTSYEQFGNVWFVKSNSDTGDAQVEDGDTMGGFFASGYNGNNYNQVPTAVYFFAEGDHTGSNYTSDGYFTAQSGNLGAGIRFQATTEDEQTKHTVCEMLGDSMNVRVPFKMWEVSKPTAQTDRAFLYTKNDGGTAEVYVLDAADNETKISPHNDKGEWEYFSKNTKTGKTVRVNMEAMVKDIEKLTGKKYIENK